VPNAEGHDSKLNEREAEKSASFFVRKTMRLIRKGKRYGASWSPADIHSFLETRKRKSYGASWSPANIHSFLLMNLRKNYGSSENHSFLEMHKGKSYGALWSRRRYNKVVIAIYLL